MNEDLFKKEININNLKLVLQFISLGSALLVIAAFLLNAEKHFTNNLFFKITIILFMLAGTMILVASGFLLIDAMSKTRLDQIRLLGGCILLISFLLYIISTIVLFIIFLLYWK